MPAEELGEQTLFSLKVANGEISYAVGQSLRER